MQLSAGQRFKLVRQDVLAALKIGGNTRVALEETPDGLFVLVDGRRIAVPSPLRWKLYRKGWDARLNRLEREYGVNRHVTLSRESVVLDIGANAGEFAHVCARYGARVHCFEPDPAVLACLRKNIAPLDNAEAYDAVIWKADGEIDFALAPERADSSVFAEGPSVRKKTVTVESFAAAAALSRIDLIKCDAEGAEPEVLEGVGGAWPSVRAVALDTGAERKGERTDKACRAILERNGFQVVDEKVGTRLMTYGLRR
jgi:FkbM family methyltransferase